MKLDLLMTGAMMPMIMEQLSAAFNLHKLWEQADKDAFIRDNGAKFTAMATSGHMAVNGEFMSKFPNLKQISSFGVGYDSIDASWAGKNGIIVTNTPDVLTEEVADTCLALLLATVRQIPQQDKYVREGKWEEKPYPLTASLQERKVGILGLGRIGNAIAKRLKAFNLTVEYHNRNEDKKSKFKYHATLKSLATAVDVLIIVTPGGAATKHLVNAEILKALGSDGILINIGRGSVVDEQALIHALDKGIIASAGLDVFEDEPRVPAALKNNQNIVVLPHIGSGTHYTRNKMGQLVVDNLIKFSKGKKALTPVAETPIK